MKNTMKIFMMSLLFIVGSLSSNAAVMPSDSTRDAGIAAQIALRVNEIQAMDKTNLSPSEKKELRKELVQMKKKAEGLDKKVYLSIGAIIIILLLLILLLR